MGKSNYTAAKGNAEEILIRHPLIVTLIGSLLWIVWMSFLGIVSIREGASVFGCAIFLVMLIVLTGIYLEWRNAYFLISAEGILECNYLKRKKQILWKECSDIYEQRNGVVLNLVFEKKIRVSKELRPYQFGTKEVKTIHIAPVLSFISNQQKEQLSEIVTSSNLAPHLKEKFFETIN